jgi:hypothetical protein
VADELQLDDDLKKRLRAAADECKAQFLAAKKG